MHCGLISGGPLAAELSQICNVHIEHDPARSIAGNLLSSRIGSPLWLSRLPKIDLVYVNTVAAIPLLRRARRVLPKSTPVLIHVHELTWVLAAYQNALQTNHDLQTADCVIAASASVRNALVKDCCVDANRVRVIHEWLCREAMGQEDAGSHRRAIRSELGISAEDTVCLGVGTVEWRKGADLIPIIAKQCSQTSQSIHFVWIGKDSPAMSAKQVQFDANRLRIQHRVHFLGEVVDPSRFYPLADVFVLPSREDPYPLAMLEAAANGLPIVCFDDSGGTRNLCKPEPEYAYRS